ncbi:hypothetical protein D3227_25635 [Mesorhizobium waimense]|uniref:Uncharacterized protein n=1 Tax=Mesorhizobium waimense TaxID=1300307 RepID=A0A3A5KCH5_9HYPH|nr:hypothetical protein [Mesorhizobium waimense]RJT32784.1 hypothetical protein D3227_25635 [Mesorhizobium waimense]
MKAPYNFDHIRSKNGEPLTEWFVRIIEWAISESKGSQGRIRYALHQLERMARDEGIAEGRREVQARMDMETAKLRKRIADLDLFLKASVSRIEAEEARQKAAEGMRNRASERAETKHGVPTNTSDAIDNLSLPKPLFTNTVRPK